VHQSPHSHSDPLRCERLSALLAAAGPFSSALGREATTAFAGLRVRHARRETTGRQRRQRRPEATPALSRTRAAASGSGSVTKASKPACARRICWHHARLDSLRTLATPRRRVRRQGVSALRSAPPPHEAHFRQSASVTSTDATNRLALVIWAVPRFARGMQGNGRTMTGGEPLRNHGSGGRMAQGLLLLQFGWASDRRLAGNKSFAWIIGGIQWAFSSGCSHARRLVQRALRSNNLMIRDSRSRKRRPSNNCAPSNSFRRMIQGGKKTSRTAPPYRSGSGCASSNCKSARPSSAILTSINRRACRQGAVLSAIRSLPSLRAFRYACQCREQCGGAWIKKSETGGTCPNGRSGWTPAAPNRNRGRSGMGNSCRSWLKRTSVSSRVGIGWSEL
jgi:hypothetical protein